MKRDAAARVKDGEKLSTKGRPFAVPTDPPTDEQRFQLRPLDAVTPVPLLPRMPPLPEPLASIVGDYAGAANVAPEMVAVPLMASTLAIIGRSVTIELGAGWVARPVQWAAIVADPGSRKSAALQPAKMVLDEAEDIMKHGDGKLREMKIDLRRAEGELESIKAKAKKRPKPNAAKAQDAGEVTPVHSADDDARAVDLEEEIEQKEKALRQPVMRMSDTTYEAVTSVLDHSPRGVALLVDEIATWRKPLDKKDAGAARPFYLTAADGSDDAYRVNRIGRGATRVPACVTVFGGTQLGPWAKMRDDDGADGLSQRFQLLVLVENGLPWRHSTIVPDDGELKALARWIVESLPRVEDDAAPKVFRLSHVAEEYFEALQRELHGEVQGANGDGQQHFAGWLAKHARTVGSIALLFHVVDCRNRDELSENISGEAMSLACAWSDFLRAHARRLFDAEKSAPMTKLARRIVDRLRAGSLGEPEHVTQNVITKKLHSHVDDVVAALEELEGFGLVSREILKRPNGPTTVFIRYRHGTNGINGTN